MEIRAVGAVEGRRARDIVNIGVKGCRDGDAGAAAWQKEPPEAGDGNKSTPGAADHDPVSGRQTG